MDRRKALRLGLAASAMVAIGGSPLRAQRGFPERPLRLVVPFPAGGSYDTIARPLAQKMGKIFGQSVFVENKGGGETSIGATDVARSSPDGYSLLLGGSPTHVFVPATMVRPPYDPIKDFTQVAVTGIQPVCIAVNPKFPANTLIDLINLVRAAPGFYNYADSAPSSRLGVEMFKQQAGNLDIVAVPYKGSAPAITDTLAGHVHIYPGVAGSVSKYHQEGLLRVLAVLSEKRLRAMPDVPTAKELGLPNLVLASFNIVCTRAGTPAPIIEEIYETLHKVLKDEDFIKFQVDNGIEPVTDSTPEAATQFVMEQIDKLIPILKSINRG